MELGPPIAHERAVALKDMGCCCGKPQSVVDEDGTEIVSPKQMKKNQKQRLHTGPRSDDFGIEMDTKLKHKKKRSSPGAAGVVDLDDDSLDTPACDFSPSSSNAEAEAAAAAEAARVAEEEAKAKAEAEAAAAAEAKRIAEEEAKAKAAAEAQAHAAKLNSQLAGRLASNKPKTRAQALATQAALDIKNDMAAFDAFVKWEDEVQKAGLAILGSKFAKAAAKKAKQKGGGANSGTDAGSNLFTLLTMEEQTRNSSFVAALQTRDLSRPLQGKALR